nr:proline-rich protein 3-like [Arachis hypogaea]
MRKKTIAKRPPREKVYKLPSKPSTRSQDRTFTPSPSPPTSPPRCDPMARTKNTPRYPAPAKPTPPPKATPSKPSSSKPGSSKGKHPAVEEPVPETTKPKSRSVPVRSQRGNPHRPLKSVREPDIDPFAHKSHYMTSHSDYNPHCFKSAMNHDFYEGVIQYRTLCPSFLADLPDLKKKGSVHSYVKGRDIILNNETISDSLKYTDVGPCAYTSVKWDDGVVKQQKGPTRSERVVLDDDDEEFIPDDSPPPSTEGTSISTGKKSTLLNVVQDVAQEFVSQSNHMIAMSKEQRKLASKHENFLRKSRDRMAIADGISLMLG